MLLSTPASGDDDEDAEEEDAGVEAVVMDGAAVCVVSSVGPFLFSSSTAIR